MIKSEESNYYSLFTDHSGIPGVPRSLDIRLFEEQIHGDAFANESSIYYEWMKPAFPDYTLNSEFYLYTKDVEEFQFDYYRFSNDFIVSDLFLSLIDKYRIPYEKAPIRIFDAANNNELLFQKRYFFVKFGFTEHVVDFERSVYEDALSDAGIPIIHKGVRYVKKYERLVLDQTKIHHEVFLAKDIRLAFNLLCGDAFVEDIIKNKLYGIIIIPLIDFTDFAENHGELGQEAYQRNKNRAKQAPQPQGTVAKPMPPDKREIHSKTLNEDEKEEINQLSKAAEELLSEEVPEEMEMLTKIALYVDELKHKKGDEQAIAYQLGSLYGQLIVERYGWNWSLITVDKETAYCVQSPDHYYACKVHHYLYALLQTDKTNNLKLLFNMMADLSKEKRLGQVLFLS